MGRKRLGLGPSFSCRLTQAQDVAVRAAAGERGVAQTLREMVIELQNFRAVYNDGKPGVFGADEKRGIVHYKECPRGEAA